MNIFQLSVLITGAGNMHNQLQQLSNDSSTKGDFNNLLKELNNIYAADNTRANRDLLQKFVIDHRNHIYREFSRRYLGPESYGEDNTGYSLK